MFDRELCAFVCSNIFGMNGLVMCVGCPVNLFSIYISLIYDAQLISGQMAFPNTNDKRFYK